jgi:Tol biopolymer transport system component
VAAAVARGRADGTGETQLTRTRRSESNPVWSPDGTKIAFVRHSDAEGDRELGTEIYVINADGSGLRNLTDDPAASDRDPVFSPLGDRIAVQAFDDFEVPTVFDLDDELLAIACQGEGASARAPAFGPDGRTVVYQRPVVDDERRVTHYDLARMAPDADGTFQGGGCTRLTRDPANELNPTFGPGGSRIAFTRAEGSLGSPDLATAEVFVMDADGANPTCLTAGVLGDWR